MDKPRTDGKHTHACDCGTTWEHGNNCAEQGEEAYARAHTCPKCGDLVYLGHHGAAGPEVNTEHPVNCAPGPRPPLGLPPEVEALARLLGVQL